MVRRNLFGGCSIRRVLQSLAWCVVLAAVATKASAQGNNYGPPPSALLDLNGLPVPGGGDGSTYQQYTTTFTASLTSTTITFAIREDPAFISLASTSVTDLTNPSGNLLTNGDFSGGTYQINGDGAYPDSWTFTNTYGASSSGTVDSTCGVGAGGAYGFGNCWYDGAVGSYDAISQPIATTKGDLYQITFWVADNSGCGCDFSDLMTDTSQAINVTVYAEGSTPPTTQPINLTLLDYGTGTVTDDSSPSAIDCSETAGVVTGSCDAQYTVNSTVTLTVNAGAGSTFAGWGGACTSSGTETTCTVTTNTTQNVSASFVLPGGTQSGTVAPQAAAPTPFNFDGGYKQGSSTSGFDFTALETDTNQTVPMTVTAVPMQSQGACSVLVQANPSFSGAECFVYQNGDGAGADAPVMFEVTCPMNGLSGPCGSSTSPFDANFGSDFAFTCAENSPLVCTAGSSSFGFPNLTSSSALPAMGFLEGAGPDPNHPCTPNTDNTPALFQSNQIISANFATTGIAPILGAGPATTASCWVATYLTPGEVPSVTVTQPASGASYAQNSTTAANYTCAAVNAGRTSLTGPFLTVSSCTATDSPGGSVANGAQFDTATLGSHTFTAQVEDSAENTSNEVVTYTVVSTSTLTLAPPSGTAQVGVTYSSTLGASGGMLPYTFSISSGSLPAGLTLSASSGLIAGMPTTAGTFSFTAKVVDSQSNSATVGCSIVVSAASTSTALTLAPSIISVGSAGPVVMTATVVSGSGTPSGTVAFFNGSSQIGTGTLSAGGVAAFSYNPSALTMGSYTITAAYGGNSTFAGSTSSPQTLVVSSPSGLTLSCPSGTAQVGVAYSSALGVMGGAAPYTFSITSGALPSGLVLNKTTGAIAGTPGAAGTFNFTSQVVDSQGNLAASSCGIAVSAPTLTLSCASGAAQVGVAYSSALTAAGGVPPYAFSISSGALPPGLAPNPSTGAVTGDPTMAGTFGFGGQVSDSNNSTAAASCSLVVSDSNALPSTTTLTLSPSSVLAGSAGPVVLTATVTSTAGGSFPTGTVTFFNGASQVGTSTLSGETSNQTATLNFNPSALAAGPYSITAVYSGDSNFASSTSPAGTLAVAQNGPFAYVANNGSNTVSVINIPTGAVTNTITVGAGPWGTAVSPDQSQVYVSNNLANTVSVINAASGTVVGTIPMQSSPFGLAFTPDGSSVYVVNGVSNTVSVINTVSQTVVATVTVGKSPVGVAMASTSNGTLKQTFAYVTNSGSNSVSVIAVGDSPTVVQTIPVGTGPSWVAVSPSSALAYVENAGSNNVSVISVASNQVTATIPVGTSPSGADFTPDSGTAYVANSGSNTVSVIDTKSSSVIATVAGLSDPVQVALTTDGSAAYVSNLGTNTESVITTASDTITGTIAVGTAPIGVAIAASAPMTLQITQPLSPSQPNTFAFGTNTYVVQYPPSAQFQGVNMTVTAVELTQAQFQRRVAGTRFANASCIVYGGVGGNCLDDEVTCSDTSGNAISCPSEALPTIAVQTSFTASQTIVNPGYLTTPIGQNLWKNILTSFADPTAKGKTQGFSEFVAVDLGTTNAQGAANIELLNPKFPRRYPRGGRIPIRFRLKSVVTGKPVSDAKVGLSVVMIADAPGNPMQKVVYSSANAFKEKGSWDVYQHTLFAAHYAPGTYSVTIYGNAFPALTGQFKILY